MSSGGDSDRYREHLGLSQNKQARKKKSRRPIYPEDTAGSIFSILERINHDAHVLAIVFGLADSRLYSISIGESPTLSSMRIRDSSSEQSNSMADTPPLTQFYEHVSTSIITTTSATPVDGMSPLVHVQKDRLGRVMIYPHGLS
ncbi:hypothetical protein EJD97_011027 [Solanum chilense]|uniref:Uncharacterized protein n=1 Tax=Solanum chilense TaxID=4083 RepID=A0A6N2BHV4_SOLCI|nr:hypothetical protein EJD97_011027 [Solanum chilense]